MSIIAVGVAAMLALTGCVGGGSGGGEKMPQGAVSTTITSEPVTLTLAYADDPPTKALIDGFTELHPNVTIKAQQTPFSDYIKSIKLSMSSDNPPDIAEYNPGAMNSLVPADLILNLDPYREAYKWDTKFPEASLEVLRSDDAAKQFGTGSLYAAPGALSVLGVFYNKKVLAEAGVEGVPETMAEFESALADVKKSGAAPFTVSGLEVGGFQLWNALLNVLGDVDQYRDWVYGKKGATIETPGAEKATRKLTEWVSKGYLPAKANATSGSDAQADFANGDSAFLITGNWAAAALADEMGENVGFFLVPGTTADAPVVASGASVAYAVSAKSDHPDVAAAFLDYLSTPEAAKIQFEGGFMPVNTEAKIDKSGLRGEIATNFTTVIDGEGIVPFPDFAAPGMIDVLTPGVQGLISKKTSEDDFLRSLQDKWSGYHDQ